MLASLRHVAACSRAGIGYTHVAAGYPGVAGCGLLTGWDRIHYQVLAYSQIVTLRLAHGLGSDTLISHRPSLTRSLRLAHGLGSDTLVMKYLQDARALRLAHGLGSDTLAESAARTAAVVAACSQAGIGYTSCQRNDRVASGCGLLTGWDRIHCYTDGTKVAMVAACSQAGIGYTPGAVSSALTAGCGLLTGWDRIH